MRGGDVRVVGGAVDVSASSSQAAPAAPSSPPSTAWVWISNDRGQ